MYEALTRVPLPLFSGFILPRHVACKILAPCLGIEPGKSAES